MFLCRYRSRPEGAAGTAGPTRKPVTPMKSRKSHHTHRHGTSGSEADAAPQVRPTVGDTSWFVHDRFGLFIHWGLYSLPARHEWVQHNEQIPEEEYRKYFEHFDPDLYDPRQWADVAARAGMKYLVITTKHHDGFCLWDSKLTDYKATNTPAGRDLLRPMVEAFRERGLRIGLLPLADRLAPPAFRHRPAHRPLPQWPRTARAERRPRPGEVRQLPERPGARAAHRLRQDRRALVRLQLPQAGRHRQGPQTTGGARSWSSSSASCSRTSS